MHFVSWASCSKRLLATWCWIFAASALAELPGVAESSDLIETRDTVIRPDGSTFEVLLCYPRGQTMDPLPVVVFGHGFLNPPELYRSTFRTLASHGYCVIAPRSFLERYPDHLAFSRDFIYCVNWITQTPPADLSSRVVDTAFGVAGHSMGGGAALLAAADDHRFVAVATLAALDTLPSSIEACDRISSSIMFITGSDDTFVPSATNTRLMFEQAPRPSYWFDIKGGSHCGFIRAEREDGICKDGRISRTEQTSISARLLVDFFDLALKGKDSGWNSIVGPQSDFDRRLTVRRKNIASLAPDRTFVSSARGGTASFTVTLTNHGEVAQSFSIDASSRIGSVIVHPPYFNHVPAFGGSVTATVTVATPAGARNKRDTVLIHAYSPGELNLGGVYAWGLIRINR